MDGLCRFCAKSELGIDVFSEEGQKRNIYSKIKLCLPINVSWIFQIHVGELIFDNFKLINVIFLKITINDGMTTHICFSCIDKLNISYEFHTTSVSVQYQLRNRLESQEKVCIILFVFIAFTNLLKIL